MAKKVEPKEAQASQKKAFVICPIGEEGSETRKRSDQILKYVITPVASECGYMVERADAIPEPGTITRQIVARILKDDLVFADLTGHNPNVFYELALRHAIKKPTVQLIQKGEKLPFDVAQSRTVVIDHKDLDSVNEAKTKLKELIICVEKDPSLVDSPISEAIDLETLKGSKDPQQNAIAELMTITAQNTSALNEIKAILNKPKDVFAQFPSSPIFTSGEPLMSTTFWNDNIKDRKAYKVIWEPEKEKKEKKDKT